MNTFKSEDLKALVLLNRLGCHRSVLSQIRSGEKPSEILRHIESENFRGKSEDLQKLKSTFDPEREIESCRQQGIELLTLYDPQYPPFLKEIPVPPLVLYVKGRLESTDQAAVAIVGSRHPSFYGLEQANRFSSELAVQGFTIISGMAKGIDGAAHEGAMRIPYGRTVAVLGSGLDRIYPRENQKLFCRIQERGAVISEHALGTPPLAENFPRRNRIIAGLSLGVLVVEAHARSGSLITAHEALDQGREVFAIPGQIDRLTSRGTHRLIKEGALLTESSEEIIEALKGPLSSSFRRFSNESDHGDTFSEEKEDNSTAQVAADEGELVGILSEKGPLAYEEMIRHYSVEPERTLSLLTSLEIRRKVRKASDGRFALV